MEPRDPRQDSAPSDDVDVRDAVRTSGRTVPAGFRAELRDRVDAALRGEEVVSVAPATSSHRTRWLAAAAVLVMAGVVAGVVALGDDDPGTVTPATLPPTTAVPTSAEPSTTEPTTTEPSTTDVPTTVVTTVPPFTPLPADRTLSVDSELGQPLTAPGVLVSKRVAAAFFQGDGWVTWDRIERGQPTTVTMFGLDGVEQWSVAIPGTLQASERVGSIEIGPMGVVYAYYESSDGADVPATVAAVPYGGKRAGQVVATWNTQRSCYETFCGPRLASTGVQVSDTEIAPFVGQQGELLEASFTAPEYATVEPGQGPPLPTEWPAFDELGNNLSSWRTTVTFQDRSWTFDVVGVNTQEGQYLAQRTSADGTVLVWLTVSDGAGQLATRSQQVLGVLTPDGTMEFLPLDGTVSDVTFDPLRLGYLVTTYDPATRTYTLARLAFAD